MGIRGLKNFLASKLSGVICACTLPPSSTLVVDGDGWLFQLVESCEGFRPDLGGCYNLFGESISEEIARLRSCGLKLVVYFDGPVQRMKLATSEKRTLQRNEQWSRFYDFCEDNVSFSDEDSFPLPTLAKAQLVDSLKRCGVPFVTCVGEADQEVAKFVCAGNAGCAAGEEKFFAYGRDSDYLAMRACPYIEFGAVQAVAIASSKQAPSPGPSPSKASKAAQLRQRPLHVAQCARVWRRSEVCEALSVTEAQFVDWAILVGNDYTAALSRAEAFGWESDTNAVTDGEEAPALPAGYGHHTLDELLRAVAARGERRIQAAAGASEEERSELQLAIDYSRAVYELQPLEGFPLDAGPVLSADEEEDDVSCVQDGFVGPQDVLDWFRSCRKPDGEDEDLNDGSAYFSDLHLYVAEVCAEVASRPQKRLGVAEHALAYIRWKASRSVAADGAAAEVSAQQLLALESMLREIYAIAEARKEATQSLQQLAASPPASSSKTPVRESRSVEGPAPSDKFPYRPRWRDVVAAHAFQRACYLLGKLLPQEAYRAKNNNPQSVYHGAFFHSVLRQMAAQGSVADGVPRPLSSGDGCSTPATSSVMDAVAKEAVAESGSKVKEQSVPATTAKPASDALPIDAFREEIIRRIERDRVTIIHGETGCGKSSCLPRFLLEHAEAASPQLPCQIIVSQPRRIAVTSLLRRLRETLGSKVGMRMGHGIRDDSPDTKIHYVTTGYLVRALAHQPERFLKCTHLIIDEVHERSVDGDLVCLLARDLLRTHPSLRVVLMSATIHTSLYRDYFAQQDDGSYGDMECLSVGVRRFPVNISYPEDILESPVAAIGATRANYAAFAPQIQAAARDIVALTASADGSGSDVPAAKLALAQYKAAVNLVRACCADGTGVLIFVSGINDITEIVQMFEPYPKYLLFPIHSDIPADEQELAFGVTPADKVKVVVATNAAESSVTIPDCDVVICLGTHKSLQYSALNHRTQLVNTWISKASSTQRAGRTGRVRPGKVFRLYSRKLFEKMQEHEVAEVHRRPLQDVVLGMWVMLEDAANFHGVTPFLQGLIEAPDMRNIEQSYQYLYESDLVTHPSDQGYLTAVGRLSGELPVDIALGRMIACGVILGVAAEAIVLAAALTLPKSPFRYANAMYSDPEEFTSIVRAKFLTAAEFDGGAYSEPIALLNLLRKWRTLDARSIPGFCHKRGLLQAVMKQFKSMSDHLAHTVATRLRPAARGAGSSRSSSADIDLARMGPLTSRKRNLLRLILLWSSSGNVLRLKKGRKKLTDTSVLVHSNEVTSDHMRGLFGDSVPYKYETRGKRVYDAHLTYWTAENYFLPLVRLLDGMADMAAEHEADCYWVVVKSDSNHSTMVVMVVPHGKRTEGVLGLLCTHVFRQEERLAANGRDIAKAIEENAERVGDAVVLVVPDASKSEVKCLNDFRDYLDGSLAMLIPVVGTAKLTASNCCPSQDSLNKVFFGSEQDGPAVPAVDRKIACQTTGSRCLLSFPDDREWDGGDANLSLEEDSDGSDDGDSSEGNATRPLIDDLPLGHRLINCCCQQVGKTRDKHLVLKRSEAAEALAARVAVPGSLQYAQQHLHDTEVHVAKLDQKLEVKLGCVAANWANIRGLKTTPITQEGGDDLPMQSSVAAILSKQTLLSCSFHRGADSLFAVAHTTLLLGATGALVACEGVTFMPPGATWMYLALLCAGADAKQLLALCPDVEPEVRVTQDQCDAAEQVASLMRGASTIVHRPDITAMISAAFEPEDGDSDSEESSEDSDAEFSDDDLAAQLAGMQLDGTPGSRKGHARTPAKGANGHFRGSATPPSSVPLIVQQGMRRGKSAASTPSTPASKAAKQEQKRAEKKARKEAAAKEQKAQRAAAKLAKAEKKLAKAAADKAAAIAPAAAAVATPSPAGAKKRAGPSPLTPSQVITAKGKGKGKKT